MKMNVLLKSILCTVAASIAVAGCDVLDPSVKGSGEIVSETRQASPFTGILVDISADVTITYGAVQSVRVTTDDNILPIITTEVSNGVLQIDSKESYSPSHGVKVAVTIPKLVSIAVDGSADVIVENAPLESVPVANFTIDIDGSGSIEVPTLNAASVAVGVDGSGDVHLKGTGGSLKAVMDGSGDITADEFLTLNGTAILGGSGDIRVYTTESLDATIDGSGGIYYRGNPTSVKRSISGSGEIVRVP